MNWKIFLSLLIGLICFIGAVVRAEEKEAPQIIVISEKNKPIKTSRIYIE